MKAKVNEGDWRSKLDASLDTLTKQSPANQRVDQPKDRDGRIEVFIKVTEVNEQIRQILKAMGVEVVSYKQSSRTFLAKIAITDLERVAKLTFVERIEPPKY